MDTRRPPLHGLRGTRLKQRRGENSPRCYCRLEMSSYVSDFILSPVISTPTRSHTHTYLWDINKSELRCFAPYYTPSMLIYRGVESVRLRRVAGNLSSSTTNKYNRSVCASHKVCVYCRCELLRMPVWHVDVDYTVCGGLTGLFLSSWMPDLPALIGFHRGWTAHRTGTSHFILGLDWMVIPAVPVHLQLNGYKKNPKKHSFKRMNPLQKFLLVF